MRTLHLLLLPLVLRAGEPQQRTLTEWRAWYYAASVNESAARGLLDALESMNVSQDPLLMGFYGMACMMRANYSWNPYHKLQYFHRGKNLLEDAIRMDPFNAELRFMRFAVQTNAPFFLGYHQQIEEDKQLIVRSWPGLTDEDLKARIRDYLVSSQRCTPAELAVMGGPNNEPSSP